MMIEHSGVLSSGDIKVTTEANTIVDLGGKVLNNLTFYAISQDIHIKINDQTDYILVSSGMGKEISKLRIYKLEIKEQGVDYYFDALYY